jgi:hypothetical protein
VRGGVVLCLCMDELLVFDFWRRSRVKGGSEVGIHIEPELFGHRNRR